MIQNDNNHIYNVLDTQKEKLAEKILDLQYNLYPELKLSHNEVGLEKYKNGMTYCISQLAEAAKYDEAIIFTSYVEWAKGVLSNTVGDTVSLARNLECMLVILQSDMQPGHYRKLHQYIISALGKMNGPISRNPTFINSNNPYSKLATEYLDFLLRGEKHTAMEIIKERVDSGTKMKDIYQYVFECTQCELGRLWQLGVISVAQEHYCTAVTQLLIAQLYPMMFKQRKGYKGHKFIGTCASDELHEMGMRMVSDFLEHDGWDCYYLGANTPTGDLLAAIEKLHPKVVGISATMFVNLSRVESSINEIRKKFSNNDVKIIVGGYPFNLVTNLWKNIGADGYSENAEEAVSFCNSLW